MRYKNQLNNLLNKYQSGGRTNTPYTNNYEFASVNPNAVLEYALQHYDDKSKSFDGVDVNKTLSYYKDHMPSLFDNYFEEKDGKFGLKKGKKYEDFQIGYNDFVDETSQMFGEIYGANKDELDEYSKSIKFSPKGTKNTATSIDDKYGRNTSSKSAFQRNIVDEQKLEKLKSLGIFTGRGVLNNIEKARGVLEEDEIQDIVRGLDIYKNADYILGTIKKQPTAENNEEPNEEGSDLKPYENNQSNFTNNLPVVTPDQSNLAPKYFGTRLRGIRAPWNVTNFVSPESSIREVNRQSNTARELLASTNPYTSASAISNLQAQENKTIADANMQAEIANQTAQNQTDNINESRILQTDQINTQEANAYETRSNVGLDSYYKEWLNYNDRQNKENLSNFNLQNQVNAVNATNPNYNIGSNFEVYQTPEEFKIVVGSDGQKYLQDKKGTITKVTTEDKTGNRKTTTSTVTKSKKGGTLRDFLKQNKKS